MANMNVSYQEMRDAGMKLAHGRDEITERLRSMQQHISALVSSGFVTDHASRKFETAYTEYTTGAETVILKLTEIQSFLTQTADAIAAMDTQIANTIQAK